MVPGFRPADQVAALAKLHELFGEFLDSVEAGLGPD